jgi:hypothetical protein
MNAGNSRAFHHLARRPYWLLATLLAIALGVRLGSIHFGLPALNDPDELMFELGAVRMLRGLTLNPGWFGHPATTTMYVLALVNVVTFLIGWLLGLFPSVSAFADAIYANPGWVILPGRIAMTIFALGTLALVFHIGRRLSDERTALIATALLTLSPVHITYSQIIRSDMMACFFMLLCISAALNIADRNRWRDYGFAALWTGLAIATKWPFALSALAILGAVFILLRTGRITMWQAWVRLAGFGVLSIAFLLLVSPYLLLDHETVLRNLTGEGQVRHLGSTGGSIAQNAYWYISKPLRDGLSLVGLALVPIGAFFLARRGTAVAILMPLIAGFFLLLCSQSMVWERWMLPLLLLCAILAAAGISGIVSLLADRSRPALIAIVMAGIMIPQALRAQADASERMNDTRQLAARWARAHIPAGSTVLIEHFAFDLVGEPWHFLFPLGHAGCVDALGMLKGKTGYAPVDQARGTRANVDYGTMDASQRASCRPDFAILTQYDRYRIEQNAFPAEYAAYRTLLAHGRIVARFEPRAGKAGGRMVTIVAFPPADRQAGGSTSVD